MKYLSKIPSCSIHYRLKDSLKNGRGISISCLREQNGQYTCTSATKVIEKELNLRPNCIRVTNINTLKTAINDQLCTVEAKVLQIGDQIPVIFEENQLKRTQKMKKIIVIGDSTGALEMNLWESHFNDIILDNSYHIRLLKIRLYNDEVSLIATADTSYVKQIFIKVKQTFSFIYKIY
jgi:hypothetical protein